MERWIPPDAQAHDGAFEDLDALACTLDDSGRNLDRVTRRELGDVCPDLFLGDLFEHVHDRSLLFVKRRGCAQEFCGPQPGRGEGTWNRPPERPTAKDSTTDRGCGGITLTRCRSPRCLARPSARSSNSSRTSPRSFASSRLRVRPSISSGRLHRVRRRASFSRHLRTASWWPLVRTAGTVTPLNSGGRVYCGIFEQAGRERLLGDGLRVDGAGEQPQDRVDHDKRRDFAAGEDVVPYRELEVHHGADPLVDALVARAEDDQVGGARPGRGRGAGRIPRRPGPAG